MEELLHDGKHYDQLHANVVKDIAYYVNQASRFGGPVLDLGCGTGRISLPIAQDGFNVVGVDLSQSMLDQAQRKASALGVDVHWIRSDIRAFNLERSFQIVILGFNVLSLLHTVEDFEECFHCVRRHLATSGRVLIDTFNPKLERLTVKTSDRTVLSEYEDPYGSGRVRISQQRCYDEASQIEHVKWWYKIGDHPERVQELRLRMHFPAELDGLLKYNGFDVEAKYGDYDERQFISGSSRQLIIAKVVAE